MSAWWLTRWGRLTAAACRIGRTQSVEPCFAAITAGALHLLFAAAGVGAVLTSTPIHCPIRAAGTAWGGAQQPLSWLRGSGAISPIFTYVCMRQDGPSGCGGSAGTPGRSGHTVARWCGACSCHTLLHCAARWTRTGPSQSGNSAHGCCTHTLRGHRGVQESTGNWSLDIYADLTVTKLNIFIYLNIFQPSTIQSNMSS